jgi:hypothetical protein
MRLALVPGIALVLSSACNGPNPGGRNLGPDVPSSPTVVTSLAAQPVQSAAVASEANVIIRLSQQNNGAAVNAVIGQQIELTLGPATASWSAASVQQISGDALTLASSTGGGLSSDEVRADLRATGTGSAQIEARRSKSCGAESSECPGGSRFFVIVLVSNPH